MTTDTKKSKFATANYSSDEQNETRRAKKRAQRHSGGTKTYARTDSPSQAYGPRSSSAQSSRPTTPRFNDSTATPEELEDIAKFAFRILVVNHPELKLNSELTSSYDKDVAGASLIQLYFYQKGTVEGRQPRSVAAEQHIRNRMQNRGTRTTQPEHTIKAIERAIGSTSWALRTAKAVLFEDRPLPEELRQYADSLFTDEFALV